MENRVSRKRGWRVLGNLVKEEELEPETMSILEESWAIDRVRFSET